MHQIKILPKTYLCKANTGLKINFHERSTHIFLFKLLLGTIHSSFFHAVNTKTFHTLFSTIFPINSFSGRTSLLWTRFLVRIQLLDLSAFQRLKTVWNNIFQYFYNNSSEIWLIDMFVWLSSKQRFCFVNFQRDRIERETKRRMSKLQIVNLSDLKQKKALNFVKKESLAQVFSCEFFEISKNNIFYRIPPVTVSAKSHKRNRPGKYRLKINWDFMRLVSEMLYF